MKACGLHVGGLRGFCRHCKRAADTTAAALATVVPRRPGTPGPVPATRHTNRTFVESPAARAARKAEPYRMVSMRNDERGM